MDQVRQSKHKRSDDKERDHGHRKRVKHKNHGKKPSKKEEQIQIVNNDPNDDEDMWVEKNVDMVSVCIRHLSSEFVIF
jgi:hypothetical protein